MQKKKKEIKKQKNKKLKSWNDEWHYVRCIKRQVYPPTFYSYRLISCGLVFFCERKNSSTIEFHCSSVRANHILTAGHLHSRFLDEDKICLYGRFLCIFDCFKTLLINRIKSIIYLIQWMFDYRFDFGTFYECIFVKWIFWVYVYY